MARSVVKERGSEVLRGAGRLGGSGDSSRGITATGSARYSFYAAAADAILFTTGINRFVTVGFPNPEFRRDPRASLAGGDEDTCCSGLIRAYSLHAAHADRRLAVSRLFGRS